MAPSLTYSATTIPMTIGQLEDVEEGLPQYSQLGQIYESSPHEAFYEDENEEQAVDEEQLSLPSYGKKQGNYLKYPADTASRRSYLPIFREQYENKGYNGLATNDYLDATELLQQSTTKA